MSPGRILLSAAWVVPAIVGGCSTPGPAVLVVAPPMAGPRAHESAEWRAFEAAYDAAAVQFWFRGAWGRPARPADDKAAAARLLSTARQLRRLADSGAVTEAEFELIRLEAANIDRLGGRHYRNYTDGLGETHADFWVMPGLQALRQLRQQLPLLRAIVEAPQCDPVIAAWMLRRLNHHVGVLSDPATRDVADGWESLRMAVKGQEYDGNLSADLVRSETISLCEELAAKASLWGGGLPPPARRAR